MNFMIPGWARPCVDSRYFQITMGSLETHLHRPPGEGYGPCSRTQHCSLVRKPTICCNHHVFCAACIELWLQKCSQCPTCRVPITPENPCREIIGATNESGSTESHSVRKHLRKTRGELLLREYEDELETLLKENEELKSRNRILESQLKASLKPAAPPTSPSDAAHGAALLEETANKLRAANELHQNVQQDVDKLKDANKTLRSQNVDLVQENLRLRAEVESRSPQKFGRFTVAALEAKISQNEREMAQLKKALERSDSYIEELESRAPKLQSEPPLQISSSVQWQDDAGDCSSSNLDSTSVDPSDSHGSLHVPAPDEAPGSQKDRMVRFAVPSTPPTPSSALSRLSLKSPMVQSEKKPSCNRLPFLRRLSFDDCASSSSFTTFSSVESPSPEVSSNLFGPQSSVNSANQSLWSGWEEPCSSTLYSCQENEQNIRNGSLADEARMDAAFLSIVSELDSMMAEGESSRSRTPRVPPDFNAASLSDLVDLELGGEQQHGTATDVPETFGESVKRKCPISLATSSPNKMSRIQ
ncbi:ORC ubiquitin ligase 1 isoform X2 [Silurus meridionalis]|uniref:ORC ubiquitin ligase 1 isoform X2 n=1 Tax=Silurus meridionalis TaxID=175797 RepID=UPI001EEC7CF8|nr:ORC ubiquitin ligase 1 isoform X2 [Silurus meridionalis]